MAETHYHPQISSYLKVVSGKSFWSEDEREHALDLAQKAPVPSRLEEDWRKTDPDAFPWNRVGDVDPELTKSDISFHELNGNSVGKVTLLLLQSRMHVCTKE